MDYNYLNTVDIPDLNQLVEERLGNQGSRAWQQTVFTIYIPIGHLADKYVSVK